MVNPDSRVEGKGRSVTQNGQCVILWSINDRFYKGMYTKISGALRAPKTHILPMVYWPEFPDSALFDQRSQKLCLVMLSSTFLILGPLRGRRAGSKGMSPRIRINVHHYRLDVFQVNLIKNISWPDKKHRAWPDKKLPSRQIWIKNWIFAAGPEFELIMSIRPECFFSG